MIKKDKKYKLFKHSFIKAVTIGTAFISSLQGMVPNFSYVAAGETTNSIVSEVEDEIEDDKVAVSNVDFQIGEEKYKLRDNEVKIFTKEQLKQVDRLWINLYDDADYSFLNYFENIKNLSIIDYGTTASLNFLNKNFCENDCRVGYVSMVTDEQVLNKYPYGRTFDASRFGFLKDIKSIDNIMIQNDNYGVCNFDWKFINDLKNTKELTVLGIRESSNFKYYDLSHLDYFHIGSNTRGLSDDNELYINSKDLEKMKQDINDFSSYDKYSKSCDSVKEIVNELNIDNSMSDEEKVNIVLAKVIDICSNPTDNKIYDTDSYSYWFKVLCEEVGIESYMLVSNKEYFNVCNINGKNYYVDVSLLAKEEILIPIKDNNNQVNYVKDSAHNILLSGNKENISKLKYYLKDVSLLNESTHKPDYIPFGLELNLESKKAVYPPTEKEFMNMKADIYDYDLDTFTIFNLTDSKTYNERFFYNFSKTDDKYKNIRIYDNAFNTKFDLINENDFKENPNIFYETPKYYEESGHSFNEERFSVLEKIPLINSLVLSNRYKNANIDWDFVGRLKVKELYTTIDEFSNIDVRKLKDIKKIHLVGDVNDLSIYITNEDIEYLKNNNVEVICNCLDELKNINNQLDEIYYKLNIKQTDTDKQKIDKILVYMFEKYEYDKNVLEKLDNNEDVSKEDALKYENGSMYGALELNTQICGNYAAFFNAMCKRANIPSFILYSHDHGWNGVIVDGKRYFIDSTNLDGSTFQDENRIYTMEELFKSGDYTINKIPGVYMEDVNDSDAPYLYIPEGFEEDNTTKTR